MIAASLCAPRRNPQARRPHLRWATHARRQEYNEGDGRKLCWVSNFDFHAAIRVGLESFRLLPRRAKRSAGSELRPALRPRHMKIRVTSLSSQPRMPRIRCPRRPSLPSQNGRPPGDAIASTDDRYPGHGVAEDFNRHENKHAERAARYRYGYSASDGLKNVIMALEQTRLCPARASAAVRPAQKG